MLYDTTKKIGEITKGAVKLITFATYAVKESLEEKKIAPTANRIATILDVEVDLVTKALLIIKLCEKVEWTEEMQVIEKFFIDNKGDAHWNAPKERLALKRLFQLFNEFEDPLTGASLIVKTFHKLNTSSDKFWNSQPFLPSVLSSSGIYSRVTQMAGKELDNVSNIIQFNGGTNGLIDKG